MGSKVICMKIRQSLSTILLLTAAWGQAQEEQTRNENDIIFGGMEIPHAYQENGEGVYHQVFDELIRGYDGTTRRIFMPSARLKRLTAKREIDCLFISTDSPDFWEMSKIEIDEVEFIGPIRELHITVYTPKGGKMPKQVDDLKTMRLASDINILPTLRKYGLKEVFSLQSQIQMLNLLSINRIEALIGFDFDLDMLAPRIGVSDKIVKTDIKLDKLVDGMACFKTKKTEKIRAHVRERLNAITESGWLDNTFEKFFAGQGK